MVRHPFPCELRKQCQHAVDILKSSDVVGTESKVKSALNTIPASLFRKCHGIALGTVFQISILLGGAKGGAGVVLKHNPQTGEWSNPIGFGLVGGQFGFQFGAAAIDLVFMLMTESAVKAFACGNVTLGGELGCALGPHGRTAEADIAIRKVAPIFTYSFSRGLLFTMSVEGIGIVQRPDANEKFYGGQYDPMQILTAPANRLRPAEPDGAAAVVKLQETLLLRARGEETKNRTGTSKASLAPAKTAGGGQSSFDDWSHPYGKADDAPARPKTPPTADAAVKYARSGSYNAGTAAAASTAYNATRGGAGSTYENPKSTPAGGGYSGYQSSYNRGGTTTTGGWGAKSPSPTTSSPSTARTTTTGYSYNRSPATTRAYDTDYSSSGGTSSYGGGSSYSRGGGGYSTYDNTDDYSRPSASGGGQYGLYDKYYDDAGDTGGEQEYDYETGKWVPKGTATDSLSVPSEPAAPEPEPEQERPRSSTPPGGAKRPSVPKRPTKLEVLYSFDADQEGDLELAEGDIVILDKADGEWCYGRNQRTGKYGMFPGAYVQEVKK